ncbi:MAG: thiamine pyrophosphate-dependent enzyme [Dethiobacteria bacterium]|jgi:2-oxoglutarate ferredoxin oxidoreductase subunit beta|nr:2-oxoacid:ferredoxin oxidoreductase subunit beta [Bacillota bacterium]
MANNGFKKYLRTYKLPHIWCPGCGHGIILGAALRAMVRLKLDPYKTVVVSGIGCSARTSAYINCMTFQTTHGRALTFASGIKLARPELTVIVFTGDGDGAAIGGNHLIHAARRNIDLTTILLNNNIYGMTGGQYSPLTPNQKLATTAPYGNLEQEFDMCKLAEAAGATYVARGIAHDPRQLSKLIEEAIKHKGFSFVEGVSHCPIGFGRRNKIASPIKLMKYVKERAVRVKAAQKMSPEELEGKFLVGELHRCERPEFTEQYARLAERLQKEAQA